MVHLRIVFEVKHTLTSNLFGVNKQQKNMEYHSLINRNKNNMSKVQPIRYTSMRRVQSVLLNLRIEELKFFRCQSFEIKKKKKKS